MTQSKPKKNSKAYELLPDKLKEVAPISLLLAESVSGPSFSLPLGYMLSVDFSEEVEVEYCAHSSKPYIDNDKT